LCVATFISQFVDDGRTPIERAGGLHCGDITSEVVDDRLEVSGQSLLKKWR